MKFTHEEYRKMIGLLKKNNYTIGNYNNYKNFKKVAILRHDIDTLVEKAVEIAEIENEEGVCGTYFVLLSTDFYNVNSLKTFQELKKIQKFGGNIGLHFDEKRYELANADQMVECILKEKQMLELALEMPITTVSMHRPSKWILNQEIEIPGMINSYSQIFFKEFKYVSDSRMNWREDVQKIIQSKEYDRLQILTHAFWYSDVEENQRQILLRFIRSANKERYMSLMDNMRDLNEFVNENEI